MLTVCPRIEPNKRCPWREIIINKILPNATHVSSTLAAFKVKYNNSTLRVWGEISISS